MKRKTASLSLALLLILSILLTPGVVNAYASDANSVKVIIHYNRPDGNYDSWNVWAWFAGLSGKSYNFNKEDNFGKIAEFTVDNPNTSTQLGFIVRKGEWEAKDVDVDRFADVKDGVAEFWLMSGEKAVYPSLAEANQAVSPKLKGAVILDMNTISLKTNIPFALTGSSNEGITVKTDSTTVQIASINSTKTDGTPTDTVLIKTKQALSLNKVYTITKTGYSGQLMAKPGNALFTSKEFDAKYSYQGNDLGAVYSKSKTSFRVWAPFAEYLQLVLYKSGDINNEQAGKQYTMKKDIKGTWTITIKGDLKGTFYTYRVKNPGMGELETADLYAKAAGINGDRSAVVDLASASPTSWTSDKKPAFGTMTDAVIYELHVRDLAMDKNSGIKAKGKYIEFAENVAKAGDETTRGINHIKELGVTHVHLLPAFDYATIDESTLGNNEFNWGYDPKNYNVPEGSYSTNPSKPEIRITEYKQMVQSLHKNGLRVVMDVVYNHTSDNIMSKFNILVPGYYYRMNEDGTFMNGSGCGSETASERAMMKKYILDSVKYWAKEYHVDGFRFDLMGLHDIDTMNKVKAELSKLDKSLIVYGEGWDMGNLDRKDRAIQPHAAAMSGIAFFNDNIRDNIKGPWNDKLGHGFVDGKQNMELEIMEGVVGSVGYNDIVKDYNIQPTQSINYVEAHDNNTLFDKLSAANPTATEADIIKMDTLANAIVLTSQGVPFMQAGSEFLRTKGGDDNSYKSPDSTNALDWARKSKYISTFNYNKGLIALRKAHPAFRMPTTTAVKSNLSFIKSPANTVAYVLKNNANKDSWKNILVVYNSNNSSADITVPTAKWNITVKGDNAGVKTLETSGGGNLKVDALSTVVMYTNDNISVADLFTTTKSLQTAACEQAGVLYLPLESIAKEVYADTKLTVTTDSITMGDKIIDAKGKTITVNNVIMVSKELVEELLQVKVLADYRRYNDDSSRADDKLPDVYILY